MNLNPGSFWVDPSVQVSPDATSTATCLMQYRLRGREHIAYKDLPIEKPGGIVPFKLDASKPQFIPSLSQDLLDCAKMYLELSSQQSPGVNTVFLPSDIQKCLRGLLANLPPRGQENLAFDLIGSDFNRIQKIYHTVCSYFLNLVDLTGTLRSNTNNQLRAWKTDNPGYPQSYLRESLLSVTSTFVSPASSFGPPHSSHWGSQGAYISDADPTVFQGPILEREQMKCVITQDTTEWLKQLFPIMLPKDQSSDHMLQAAHILPRSLVNTPNQAEKNIRYTALIYLFPEVQSILPSLDTIDVPFNGMALSSTVHQAFDHCLLGLRNTDPTVGHEAYDVVHFPGASTRIRKCAIGKSVSFIPHPKTAPPSRILLELHHSLCMFFQDVPRIRIPAPIKKTSTKDYLQGIFGGSAGSGAHANTDSSSSKASYPPHGTPSHSSNNNQESSGLYTGEGSCNWGLWNEYSSSLSDELEWNEYSLDEAGRSCIEQLFHSARLSGPPKVLLDSYDI